MIQIYISKLQLFKYIFLALILIFSALFCIIKTEYVALGYASVIFFSFCLIVIIIGSNPHRPYISLTPTYIKIKNYENLLWTDIKQVVAMPYNSGIAFRLKDTSKYHLTKLQKINDFLSATPFWLSVKLISKEDAQTLKKYIISQCDPS